MYLSIDAAFAALNMKFPALTVLSDLPERTTGYDGTQPGLAGQATVKLFRITTTPSTFYCRTIPYTSIIRPFSPSYRHSLDKTARSAS
jgi:hypothetical protein